MNSYCINIDLDISPLKENIMFDPAIYSYTDYWKSIDISDINPNLTALLLDKGLMILNAGTFYSNGYQTHNIHVDHVYITDRAKITWTYGDDHIMNWYSIKNLDLPKQSQSKFDNRNYIMYTNDEVELLFSKKTGKPSIVQVGIPHNAVNYSGERRSITLGIYDAKTRIPATFNQVLKAF
jgi:hypothetical protein